MKKIDPSKPNPNCCVIGPTLDKKPKGENFVSKTNERHKKTPRCLNNSTHSSLNILYQSSLVRGLKGHFKSRRVTNNYSFIKEVSQNKMIELIAGTCGSICAIIIIAIQFSAALKADGFNQYNVNLIVYGTFLINAILANIILVIIWVCKGRPQLCESNSGDCLFKVLGFFFLGNFFTWLGPLFVAVVLVGGLGYLFITGFALLFCECICCRCCPKNQRSTIPVEFMSRQE